MKPSLDWDILQRYLSGEATPEESAHVRAWIDGDTEKARLIAAFQKESPSLGRSAAHWDADDMWNRFKERQERVAVVAQSVSSVRTRDYRSAYKTDTGYMTSPKWQRQTRGKNAWLPPFFGKIGQQARGLFVLGVAVIGIGVYGYTQRTTLFPSVWATDTHSSSSREIVTIRGQHSSIELSDGSRLVVAPESRVTIPDDFGKKTRTLIVDGEAFITVAHDLQHPFIVKTGRVTTRVLGTMFSVRKYASDTDVRVAVVQGKVAVDGTVVGAGNVSFIGADGLTNVQTTSNMDLYVGWVTGRLVFTDRPIREVVAELSRAYDIDIRIGNPSLDRHRVTASFDNQSVQEMLRDLSLAVGAKINRSEKVVVLHLP